MLSVLAQCANARPQKNKRERPGALLARRTRTFRKCSFDARSKGQPRPLPFKKCMKNRTTLIGRAHLRTSQPFE